MARMTEDELRALTDGELRQSVGYWGGKLAGQRQKAEYYYLGLAKGDLAPPEIEGRSKVVSTDVRNTIESMLPQLMVKFVSGDTVVEFEPTQQDDEERAKLCTDYLNYLFLKKQNGHAITYTWFKDALLQKNGIIKVWWDTRVEETREEYKGLDDVELAQIMDDEEVEVTEHDSYPDEEDQEQRQEAIQHLTAQAQQAMQAAQQNPQAMQAVQQIQAQIQQIEQTPPKFLHDVTCKRSKKGGKLTVENVPPEEFLITRNAKSIATARFCAHRRSFTMSELKSMGYDTTKIELSSDDSGAVMNAERVERLAWDDEYAYLNEEHQTLDESQRVVWVSECYIRADYDGDGIAELRKVTRCGNAILDNEVVDVAPFVSICPIPMPHKFYGLSIADVAEEAQRIKTSLLRSHLDQQYLNVNGRMYAVEGQVNLDDLLTSRPGGVVRVKQPNAAGPLQPSYGDPAGVMHSLEYMEDFLENSTGWTRYSQGNDSGSLNKTATGVNIITNRSDMRLDLVARNFAEGFVSLFRMMLKLVTQHQDKEVIAKISGQWVPVDPREWRNQFDVSINVGLGTGNKDQQAAHLMNLMQVQGNALQIGAATPENIYNAACELAKLNGFKNGDKFFSDPSKAPPQQHQPDPAMLKVQADQQNSQASLQLEEKKHQWQAQIEQQRNQMEAEREDRHKALEAQLEQIKVQAENQREAQRLEFERWKTEYEGSVKITQAQIAADQQNNAALIQAEQAANQVVSGGESDPNTQILQTLQSLVEHLARPKQIVRGPDGRAIGVQ